jgi:predicted ATPase/DNA-binding SARP family transcriptional activator
VTRWDPAAIEFRLLGPVEAVRSGNAIALGGSRQRALLALLLMERGRPVTVDRLVEELWQGEPPTAAITTLRTYVSKLRSALGTEILITGSSSGYVLDVAPESVDALRFEQLAREGGQALARGASARAAERLRSALELWRGLPFADLADEGALRLEAVRLEQLRLRALEERIDAELALGGAAEVVDELEALVGEHPFRERLWAQLMLALYRSGRQAEALDAYQRARGLLDTELGLEPSEDLKQLQQAILRQDVPEVAPPEERHNLPAPTTSFIGRELELGELERMLSTTRVITLTGVGGAGKTRLALAVAERAAADFPDGIIFCDLAPLAQPALVPRELARTLGIAEEASVGMAEVLAQGVGDAELLLVLDNCEHLREVTAELGHALLVGCPRLRLLATSREPLGIPGEVDYPVPPLGLPPADADSAEMRSSEALALFFDRALAARPGMAADAAALRTASQICRDLDGLPLAIELAAARVKALSLDEIAARLSDRFRFLVSWRRLAPARHRTLEEAIDWSYELLRADEQELLARLSVFAGGFTLDAAAQVCLDGDGGQALELVERLVEVSLLIADHHDGATRYRMLETIREYAARRLLERDEVEALRLRHSEWCLALAESAEPELTGEGQAHWFSVLEAEHDNLRSALTYLTGVGEPEPRLRLTISVTRFWYVRGYLTEARQWLQAALEAGGDQPLDLRRRALTAAAALALLQGDYPVATAFAEQSLDTARESGNQVFVANALSNLGAIVLAAGDHDRARDLLEKAVALARDVGDDRIAALAINNLGDLSLTLGEYERAGPLFEESLELLRARGDTANVARSLFNLGAVSLMLGRTDEAESLFGESVERARAVEDKEDLVWCLEGYAGLAAATEDGQRAAMLLGAAEALLEEMGAAFKPFERQLHGSTEARARALCGEVSFAEATRRGASMTLDQALDYAAKNRSTA